MNNILAAKGASNMISVNGSPAAGNTEKTYKWNEQFDDITYSTSQYTDEEVTNQFEDCDINYWQEDSVIYLSRNDWDAIYPVSAVKVEATDEMIEVLNGTYYEKAEDAQSFSDYTLGDNQSIPLATLIGKKRL